MAENARDPMNKNSSSSIPPKKSLGQNFLTNLSIINKILTAIDPKLTDQLVEIGPGQGALTFPLLERAKKITAIEIDKRLITELKNQCSTIGDLRLYHQDVLTFNFKDLVKEKEPLRIVGNLPYSISTPLLFHLIDQIKYILDMHFMLQKEVADRITAKPNTKDYGRLSVMIQYHCQTKKLFNVPASAFFPKPKVESAFIALIPFKTLPYPSHHFETFKQLVRETFNHRRKMLSHTVKTMIPNAQIPWDSLGISPKARPETLSVKDFVALSNLIYSQKLMDKY